MVTFLFCLWVIGYSHPSNFTGEYKVVQRELNIKFIIIILIYKLFYYKFILVHLIYTIHNKFIQAPNKKNIRYY
jgi:hypothetical protein